MKTRSKRRYELSFTAEAFQIYGAFTMIILGFIAAIIATTYATNPVSVTNIIGAFVILWGMIVIPLYLIIVWALDYVLWAYQSRT